MIDENTNAKAQYEQLHFFKIQNSMLKKTSEMISKSRGIFHMRYLLEMQLYSCRSE